MKLTIENTTQIVHINGIPARVWEGVSERRVKVQCLVTRIAVHKDEDCTQFETELAEQRPPSAETAAFPLRMIL